MKIKLHLLVTANGCLGLAVTPLPLIAREGVGNGGLGGLVSSLGRQVQGGGDLVEATRRDPAVLFDDLLQRLDLAFGGACSDFHPADSLRQRLLSLGTDPRHFGDVGLQGLVICLQLGLEAGYALGQGRLGIAVDGDPLLCRRETFALLGHGGLRGLLLDLPQGSVQRAADFGQLLLLGTELRLGDRLG